MLFRSISTLDGWYRVLRDLADIELPPGSLPVPESVEAALRDDLNTPQALAELAHLADEARQRGDAQAKAALRDDLNTPQALAELAVLADAARHAGSAEAKAALLGGGALLGLLQQDPESWFKQAGGESDVDAAQVEELLEQRRAARAARDFKRADAIRDELAALGVVIEDGAQGTRWSLVKA